MTPAFIMVIAFSFADNGALVAACDPMQFDTPEDAVRVAGYLAGEYAGVLAWSREAEPEIGGYGPPTILFHSGDVPKIQ